MTIFSYSDFLIRYRQKREYDVMKQNNENINTEHQLEKQRLDIEQERLEIEKQKQQAESLRQKQEYEKHMAEMELKVRLKILRVCVGAASVLWRACGQ